MTLILNTQKHKCVRISSKINHYKTKDLTTYITVLLKPDENQIYESQ